MRKRAVDKGKERVHSLSKMCLTGQVVCSFRNSHAQDSSWSLHR